MGHRNADGSTASAGVYRALGAKIDGLAARTPWNETFYDILKALYTPAEAEVLVAMPCGLSSLAEVARATGIEPAALRAILARLCEKGLVFDLRCDRIASEQDQTRYMPAPLVVGIFELTMMRTRGALRSAEWARLFHDYMHSDDAFYAANFGHGERVSILRTLPHAEAIPDADAVEILDYEKATAIVQEAAPLAIGLCSCRHEKLHAGVKSCDAPLDTCSSLGPNADVLIRHGMAREVSRSEMLENLARSRELKLVLGADNVQQRPGFICHCCGCCCNVLLGVTQHGYPNAIVTSTYIAKVDEGQRCRGGAYSNTPVQSGNTPVQPGNAAGVAVGAYSNTPVQSGNTPVQPGNTPVQPGNTAGVTVGAYSNTPVQSECIGCGQCARACPIHAITMTPVAAVAGRAYPTTRNLANPKVDETLCLGCGVCALSCPKGAMRLAKRAQRVLHPETTFERVILASLERGTLQNQLLGDPQRITNKFLCGLIGGFLRLPPVKQALMSDQLRSTFLAACKTGVRLQGKGWLTEM